MKRAVPTRIHIAGGVTPLPHGLWDQLALSAQRHMIAMADILATGFTGELRVLCSQGGVQETMVVRANLLDLLDVTSPKS